MQKFTFKFQSILNLKRLEERQLQEEFVCLRQSHAEALESVHQLERSRQEQLMEIEEIEATGYLDLTNALLYRDYLHHLHQEITLKRAEECRCRVEMDEGFRLMVEKTKERKTFDRLKEKRKTAFLARRLKLWQEELDDLAQGRFIHQKKSSDLEAKR